jgi:hypothetical protein
VNGLVQAASALNLNFFRVYVLIRNITAQNIIQSIDCIKDVFHVEYL